MRITIASVAALVLISPTISLADVLLVSRTSLISAQHTHFGGPPGFNYNESDTYTQFGPWSTTLPRSGDQYDSSVSPTEFDGTFAGFAQQGIDTYSAESASLEVVFTVSQRSGIHLTMSGDSSISTDNAAITISSTAGNVTLFDSATIAVINHDVPNAANWSDAHWDSSLDPGTYRFMARTDGSHVVLGSDSSGSLTFVVTFDHGPTACSAADVASLGGATGPDGQISADDLIVYLQAFFAGNLAIADIASLGGSAGADGQLTADDLVGFLSFFFNGCP